MPIEVIDEIDDVLSVEFDEHEGMQQIDEIFMYCMHEH